jgi:hypothetical protein
MPDTRTVVRRVIDAYPDPLDLDDDELDVLIAYLVTLPPAPPGGFSPFYWEEIRRLGAGELPNPEATRRHLEYVRSYNERRHGRTGPDASESDPAARTPKQPPAPENRPEAAGRDRDAPTELPDLVTLDQMAAAVSRSKRTLERHKTNGTLPEPYSEGGGGKFALYDWKVVRPWLEAEFGVTLPVRFPGNIR